MIYNVQAILRPTDDLRQMIAPMLFTLICKNCTYVRPEIYLNGVDVIITLVGTNVHDHYHKWIALFTSSYVDDVTRRVREDALLAVSV